MRVLFLVIVVLVTFVTPEANAQYDWSRHFGPQQTGFEKYWFGEWDLEVLTLRGIVDWQSYSSDVSSAQRPRKVSRTATRFDQSDGSAYTVHSSFALFDETGREKTVTYLDPQTGKTLQRETFKYDDRGRLREWRPVKNPKDVAFASTARTLYAGALPFGRVQFFSYYDDGTLKEWKACTADRTVENRCTEAFLKFDEAGRLGEFVWLQNVYLLERNDAGNLERITIRNVVNHDTSIVDIHYDDLILREKYVDEDNAGLENIVAKGLNGTVAQYRVPSAAGSLQYTTTTWTYDAAGRISEILKGLDSYKLSRDGSGKVVELEQSVTPHHLSRSFGRDGRLRTQSPPLSYNRYDLVEAGREAFTYDANGNLEEIAVASDTGEPIARLVFEYEYATGRGPKPGVRRGR